MLFYPLYQALDPPWLLTRPVINLNLHCSDKSNTPPDIFRHRFYELCDHFKNYYRIFTDGPKEGNRVAAVVVHRDNTKSDYQTLQAFPGWTVCPVASDRHWLIQELKLGGHIPNPSLLLPFPFPFPFLSPLPFPVPPFLFLSAPVPSPPLRSRPP